GRQGRVFYIRLGHGEDVRVALTDFCRKEKITSGWFQMFGALERGDLVVGPEEKKLPPTPVFSAINMPHELVGVGSILEGGAGPSIHMHTAAGRGSDAIVGCIRGNSETFLILEVLLVEVTDLDVKRMPDENGLELPVFKGVHHRATEDTE
ncbi:MAG: PPC domain-containing DNA-binding protein, partial [bacterium]